MKRPNSSMQLTRAADYAVRVMVQLVGSSTEQRLLLPELAAATDAPESFLSKVLQALSHAGLIDSKRGHTGGFHISIRGRSASLELGESFPDSPSSWMVAVNNRGSKRDGDVTVRLYAVCLKK